MNQRSEESAQCRLFGAQGRTKETRVAYSRATATSARSRMSGNIGTAASHGCMCIMPSDVADLMTRVAVGNPVYIRR